MKCHVFVTLLHRQSELARALLASDGSAPLPRSSAEGLVADIEVVRRGPTRPRQAQRRPARGSRPPGACVREPGRRARTPSSGNSGPW